MPKNKSKSVIKLKNVSKTYFGEVDTPVLFDINLEIGHGSLCSIIGQSGSGKSTLLNVLSTLDNTTSGEVYINGKATTGMSPGQLAKLRNETFGFVFQFHYLLPEYTVIENVLMPKLIQKGGKISQVEKERAIKVLELVGLSDKIHMPSYSISGGQQQRTAIARALMNEPSIILADEPTGNLDSDTSKSVFELFCKINKELGTTFVIVTHDDRIAAKTARIIEIKDGRILSDKKIKK